MSELTCTQVRDASAEYALGILPAVDRADMARHLLGCDACRREVNELTQVGLDLLGLVPDAEPPLGFDRRVLAHVQRPRRPGVKTWVASSVAAAAAAAAVLVSVLSGSNPHPQHVLGTLTAAGRPVGTVYTEGHPLWLEMNVNDPEISGPVTCYVIKSGGQRVMFGRFDMVDGNGYWGAPLDHAGSGNLTGVQLVAAGQVVATASFKT